MKKIIQITSLIGAFAATSLQATLLPGSSAQINNSHVKNATMMDLMNYYMGNTTEQQFNEAMSVSVDLSNESLTFTPNPGYLGLEAQTGSFTDYDTALISTLNLTEADFGLGGNPFISFGAGSAAADTLDNAFYASEFLDPIFTEVYDSDTDQTLTTISLTIKGAYDGFGLGDNEVVLGSAKLTLQALGNDIDDKYNNGETIGDLAFSGVIFSATEAANKSGNAPVPEPSTIALFGMAFVGLGFAGYRKRRVV